MPLRLLVGGCGFFVAQAVKPSRAWNGIRACRGGERARRGALAGRGVLRGRQPPPPPPPLPLSVGQTGTVNAARVQHPAPHSSAASSDSLALSLSLRCSSGGGRAAPQWSAPTSVARHSILLFAGWRKAGAAQEGMGLEGSTAVPLEPALAPQHGGGTSCWRRRRRRAAARFSRRDAWGGRCDAGLPAASAAGRRPRLPPSAAPTWSAGQLVPLTALAPSNRLLGAPPHRPVAAAYPPPTAGRLGGTHLIVGQLGLLPALGLCGLAAGLGLEGGVLADRLVHLPDTQNKGRTGGGGGGRCRRRGAAAGGTAANRLVHPRGTRGDTGGSGRRVQAQRRCRENQNIFATLNRLHPWEHTPWCTCPPGRRTPRPPSGTRCSAETGGRVGWWVQWRAGRWRGGEGRHEMEQHKGGREGGREGGRRRSGAQRRWGHWRQLVAARHAAGGGSSAGKPLLRLPHAQHPLWRSPPAEHAACFSGSSPMRGAHRAAQHAHHSMHSMHSTALTQSARCTSPGPPPASPPCTRPRGRRRCTCAGSAAQQQQQGWEGRSSTSGAPGKAGGCCQLAHAAGNAVGWGGGLGTALQRGRRRRSTIPVGDNTTAGQPAPGTHLGVKLLGVGVVAHKALLVVGDVQAAVQRALRSTARRSRDRHSCTRVRGRCSGTRTNVCAAGAARIDARASSALQGSQSHG